MRHPQRSTLVLLAAIGLLLAGSLSVSAQGRRGGGPPPGHGYGMHQGPGFGPGGFGPVGGILRQLDLSEEQRQQVRDRLQQAMDGELGQLMRDQREKRQQVRRLVHDPNAEETDIANAVRDATADAEALALAEHRLIVSVFEVLTPEQRDEALELLAQGPHPRWQRRYNQGPYGLDPAE